MACPATFLYPIGLHTIQLPPTSSSFAYNDKVEGKFRSHFFTSSLIEMSDSLENYVNWPALIKQRPSPDNLFYKARHSFKIYEDLSKICLSDNGQVFQSILNTEYTFQRIEKNHSWEWHIFKLLYGLFDYTKLKQVFYFIE